MKKLAISATLDLPVDAATQTFAFIARKGAGKTYAAGKLTELLLEANVQVVILDTVGNWYGLRIAADGKGKGFDIPVFGGLRGDLPLQATAGELVADVVVESGRSIILDLSQFSLGDRKRFATAFGERLWEKKKSETHPSPLMLVIEESQLIIPQQVGRDEARMVGIYEEIIRLGRNYGIGCMMISQRPQSVNKEVLNQTECLFVLQVNGAQERKALKDWIVHQGMDTNLLDELPSLPKGTAYVWSPQWLGILRKVEIATKITLDASATPKVGDKTVRKNPAPLDLSELQKQMAQTIESAKASDPAELKRIIAELKKKLLTAEQKKPEVKQEVTEILTDADRKLITRVVDELPDEIAKLQQSAAKLVGDALEKLRPVMAKVMESTRAAARPAPATAKIAEAIRNNPKSVTLQAPEGDMPGTQQKIVNMLFALVLRGLTPNKEMLAAWLAIHHNGSRFNSDLARLRESGYLDGYSLTDSGQKSSRAIPMGLDAFKSVLEGTQKTIVEILENNLARPLSKEELAELLGIHHNGSRFNGDLARLRKMGVIPERGAIKLNECAFA